MISEKRKKFEDTVLRALGWVKDGNDEMIPYLGLSSIHVRYNKYSKLRCGLIATADIYHNGKLSNIEFSTPSGKPYYPSDIEKSSFAELLNILVDEFSQFEDEQNEKTSRMRINSLTTFLKRRYGWERLGTVSPKAVSLSYTKDDYTDLVVVYIGFEPIINEWIVNVRYNPKQNVTYFPFHEEEISTFYKILEELKNT